MSILTVTLRASLAGQQHINKWAYVSSGTPATVTPSFALVHSMGFVPAVGVYPADKLFAAIRALVAPSLVFGEVEAKNLYDPVDFYVLPFGAGVAGTNASSQRMSPTISYGWRTNRVRTDIRRATKRIGGVVEDYVGEDGFLGGGALAACDAIAALMSAVLTYDDEGNTISFSPAVLSFTEETDEEGKVRRVKYPTEVEQLQHTATGVLWSTYTSVRTQVSRQYGRGR